MTSEPRCHAQGISAADDTVTSSAIGCMSSVMTRQKRFVEMGVNAMVLMSTTPPC